ncbi:MAG: DUF5011 domain-containing protein [Firmicutes bacterium]|nr:DUF5011 domain-containing protein [Bacillota bacterium]
MEDERKEFEELNTEEAVSDTKEEITAEDRLEEGEVTIKDGLPAEPETKAPAKPKKKKLWLILLLVAVLAVGGAAAWYFLRPAVKFSDSRPVSEAGETFDPMSIVEGVRGGELSEVSVKGPEGALEKGLYKYTYSFRGKDVEVSLTVKDTKAPELTLKPEEERVFNDREEIDPAKIVEAKDAGKVTLSIDPQGNDLKTPGMYEVIVKAADEDKNSSELTASIKVEPYDTQPPVISGAGDVWVYLGSGFDPMAGVSVSDDKDPNPSLVVDGSNVNTNAEGSYTVVYTAKDEYGNEAVVNRTVTVYQSAWYTPGSDPSVSWDATGEWGQPYLVAVNRAYNCVTVYAQDGNGNYTAPVCAFPCSTAREGYNTPTSIEVSGQRFHSAWRADWCYMVDGSWGRYAISIDTTLAPNPYDQWGIMFHSVCYYSQSIDDLEYDEYNKLGGVASLGCIRLCLRDEKWLYDNCPEGFPIVIYDDWTSPGPLGKPDPIRIDTSDWRKGWDPTDPDPNNPWNN